MDHAGRIANFEEKLSTGDVEYKVEDTSKDDIALQGDGVKVLWTDLHDAQFAQAWPERVRHGELELTRDHVMPGQKPIYGAEILANDAFKEKQA